MLIPQTQTQTSDVTVSASYWDGSVGIAGHNRGVTNHFGKIHTLKTGDQITYTTQLGTRTYEVFCRENRGDRLLPAGAHE